MVAHRWRNHDSWHHQMKSIINEARENQMAKNHRRENISARPGREMIIGAYRSLRHQPRGGIFPHRRRRRKSAYTAKSASSKKKNQSGIGNNRNEIYSRIEEKHRRSWKPTNIPTRSPTANLAAISNHQSATNEKENREEIRENSIEIIKRRNGENEAYQSVAKRPLTGEIFRNIRRRQRASKKKKKEIIKYFWLKAGSWKSMREKKMRENEREIMWNNNRYPSERKKAHQ